MVEHTNWFTHMRNFNYINSDFKMWYKKNMNNIYNGNIRDD